MTTGRINQVTDRGSLSRGQCPQGCTGRTRNSPPCPPEPAVEPSTTVRLCPWGPLPDRSPNATSPQPAGHHQRLLPRCQHTGKARTRNKPRRTPSIPCESCSHPTDGNFLPSFSPETNPFLRSIAPSGGGRHIFRVRQGGACRLDRWLTPTIEKRGPAEGPAEKAGTICAVFSTTSPGSRQGSCRSLFGGETEKVPRQRPSERCHVANDYFPR